jgi:plastocyanin
MRHLLWRNAHRDGARVIGARPWRAGVLLVLGAAAMLAVSGGAGAATTTVTITKTGFVPTTTTIAQGDTVQFANSDTVTHQIAFKTTAGITCSPNPLVLQPAETGTCAFPTAGSYTYTDPTTKGNTFRGAVIVKAPGESLTLAASPLSVVYGGHVTLAGTLSTHQAGVSLDVLGLQCGSSTARKLGTVQTTTNGAYSFVAQPLMMKTTYTVTAKRTTSPSANGGVRPKLSLRKVAAHRYSLRISAATSFAGRYAAFQRFNGSHWVAVKMVRLHANLTGVTPTVITTASFRSTLRARVHVRALLGQVQVGSCYLPGISNTIPR